MEEARAATSADVPRLVELARQARDEAAGGRGGALFVAREARPEPLDEGLADELDAGDRAVFVGTYDGVPVGYGVVVAETLRTGERLGRLDELFVEPEARGVGVGEALMEAIIEWCRQQDCGAVDAPALPGDRATKNFFEVSGFSARLLIMHRRL